VIDPAVPRLFVAKHCTDREREAIQVVFVDGMGIRRGAQQLGITPGSVRDRLDRVRERARRHGLRP